MQLLFDLHTHTVASGHAFSTWKENIEEAAKKGLMAVGPGGPLFWKLQGGCRGDYGSPGVYRY